MPLIHHVRSLHIPYIANHIYHSINVKDLALQIVDVVAIRPEIELCYIALANTCFELIEKNHSNLATSSHNNVDAADDNDSGENNPISMAEFLTAHDGPEPQEEGSIVDDSSDEESEKILVQERPHTAPTLREILFYDDKISIFKARHGQL